MGNTKASTLCQPRVTLECTFSQERIAEQAKAEAKREAAQAKKDAKRGKGAKKKRRKSKSLVIDLLTIKYGDQDFHFEESDSGTSHFDKHWPRWHTIKYHVSLTTLLYAVWTGVMNWDTAEKQGIPRQLFDVMQGPHPDDKDAIVSDLQLSNTCFLDAYSRTHHPRCDCYYVIGPNVWHPTCDQIEAAEWSMFTDRFGKMDEKELRYAYRMTLIATLTSSKTLCLLKVHLIPLSTGRHTLLLPTK